MGPERSTARHTLAGHRYYTDADVDCFLSMEPPLTPVRTVVHKENPCWLGFDWFAYYADNYGCEIRVVNQVGFSPPVELVADLMSDIQTLFCRVSGLRQCRKQVQAVATDG